MMRPDSKCPCGSGKQYQHCHDPSVDNSENNIWKGPGYPRGILFGYGEKFSGIEFQNIESGEVLILQDGDKIPIAKYFTIPRDKLEGKAIVRSLSITQSNYELIFSGKIEIKSDAEVAQLVVGASDYELAEFGATVLGHPSDFEMGKWLCLIDSEINPEKMLRTSNWFRCFKSSGYLVEFPTRGQLSFKLTKPINPLNIFTLCLPFNDIEISSPIVSIQDFSAFTFEIAREEVYWELPLTPNDFDEYQSKRRNAIEFIGVEDESGFKLKGFRKDTRKTYRLPRKLFISLSLPSKSPALGSFSELLENSIRAIAEGNGFDFIEKKGRILEADFRDHLVTVMKSTGLFAEAEPTRRKGFIDILMKRKGSEAIVELKVWGRRNYKEVISQVLSYSTPWTTEYSTVMINPNKGLIIDKFCSNAKSNPGFVRFDYIERSRKPIQKLISTHYSEQYGRYFIIVHFIINLSLFV